MSIYTTVEITRSEAIQLIVNHVCSNPNYPQIHEGKTDDELLERILRMLTESCRYSPYHMCNYSVVESPRPESSLKQYREDNYIYGE